jgi:hypothetical protein
VIRAPFWWMKKRPPALFPLDTDRLGPDMKQTVLQKSDNALDPSKMGNQEEDK